MDETNKLVVHVITAVDFPDIVIYHNHVVCESNSLLGDAPNLGNRKLGEFIQLGIDWIEGNQWIWLENICREIFNCDFPLVIKEFIHCVWICIVYRLFHLIFNLFSSDVKFSLSVECAICYNIVQHHLWNRNESWINPDEKEMGLSNSNEMIPDSVTCRDSAECEFGTNIYNL